MTNYGARAILALPADKLLPSDVRLLIALETITPDEAGDRRMGIRLLASIAGLSYGTARDSIHRLDRLGFIGYKAGIGRGNYTAFRILFELKVLALGQHDSEPVKVLAQGQHDSEEKCWIEPVKVLDRLDKSAGANAPTSANANTALEAFALEASALAPLLAQLAAAARLDAREIEIISGELMAAPEVRDPVAYLRKVLADGDAIAYATRALRAHRIRAEANDAPGPRSESCKQPGHKTRDCPYDWCMCRCHGRRSP